MTVDKSNSRKKFDGGGFSKEPFSPEEFAQHRHMFRVLDVNFVSLDNIELQAVRLIGNIRRVWWLFPLVFSAGVAAKLWGLA